MIGAYFVHLSIITHSVKGRILRRSCGDYANFSYVQLDKVLQGEEITTLVVSSEVECERACVDELQCKSIHIEMSKKARQCELNKRSTADASDGVVLTPKSGWMFKSTSYTDNLVIFNFCYVMLCYVMLCYVMLCYVMLCYVLLCYVMLCYVMLCYVMLCYVMLCYVMLCYVMLCYVMLCYVMLCYVMLCYVILCFFCRLGIIAKG